MLGFRRNKVNISIPTITEAGPANPKSEADLSDQSQPGSKKTLHDLQIEWGNKYTIKVTQ